MSQLRPPLTWRWLLALGLTLPLACGKKGPPLAPLRAPPPRVDDLEARQRGDTVLLSWTRPQVVKAAPEAPVRLEVFELGFVTDEEGAGPSLSEFERRAERILRLELDAVARSGVLAWLERPLGQGDAEALAWAVRYVSRSGGRADLSNLAWLEPGEWPEPPPPPDLRLGAGGVRVEVAAADVNLYKRDQQDAGYPPRPLVAGVAEISLDRDTTYGRTRCYAAALVREDVESPLGEERCVLLRDIAPPSAPEGLAGAAAADGRVLLVWDPRPEPDVGGYHVYRRLASDDQELRRLTPEPVTEPRFADATAEGGVVYEYVVTTLDDADPPNESGPSKPRRVKAGGLERR